jgi:hypothetical protein
MRHNHQAVERPPTPGILPDGLVAVTIPPKTTGWPEAHYGGQLK